MGENFSFESHFIANSPRFVCLCSGAGSGADTFFPLVAVALRYSSVTAAAFQSLRSRYTELLFLFHAGAQRSNSAAADGAGQEIVCRNKIKIW